MISGGQTAEVKVGRQILCKEKPSTRATSTCAKKLTATVAVAKKGLTAQQQKLWRKYVYTPALLQAQRFCGKQSQIKQPPSAWEGTSPTRQQQYKSCVNKVLAGKTKFKGLFGKKFKWSDFLIKGAKIIKKLPAKLILGPTVPGGLGDSNVYKGTNPNE